MFHFVDISQDYEIWLQYMAELMYVQQHISAKTHTWYNDTTWAFKLIFKKLASNKNHAFLPVECLHHCQAQVTGSLKGVDVPSPGYLTWGRLLDGTNMWYPSREPSPQMVLNLFPGIPPKNLSKFRFRNDHIRQNLTVKTSVFISFGGLKRGLFSGVKSLLYSNFRGGKSHRSVGW